LKKYEDFYWINEGGYGNKGALGAGEMLQHIPHAEKYTHIVCAVGTGTTLAGIINASHNNQNIIGISAMKGNELLKEDILQLLPNEKNFSLLHQYHFGGYAKHPPQLIEFMKNTWQQFQLPTDIVYTAKNFLCLAGYNYQQWYSAAQQCADDTYRRPAGK